MFLLLDTPDLSLLAFVLDFSFSKDESLSIKKLAVKLDPPAESLIWFIVNSPIPYGISEFGLLPDKKCVTPSLGHETIGNKVLITAPNIQDIASKPKSAKKSYVFPFVKKRLLGPDQHGGSV